MAEIKNLKPASVEVGPEAPKGETRPRRYWETPDELVKTPKEGITCVAHILEHTISQFPDREGLGWRELKRIVSEKKEVTKIVGGKEVKEEKEWKYFELGPYQWWTYEQFGELVAQAASALVETGHTRETVFNIYSATTPRWQLMAQACARQGIIFATAYDSLGEDGLRHSIEEPDVYGLFTNASLLGTVANVIAQTPSLKVLVYDGKSEDVPKGALNKIKEIGSIKVFTLDEFLELGKKNPHEKDLPGLDDPCTYMYTSGSTGDPKGVILTNGNVVATLAGLQIMLHDILQGEHVFMAYLPLAHIFEFSVELALLFLGIKMGYGSPKTLTDQSVRNCAGDIRELRPTILIGVPAVWELIRKGIMARVKAGGLIRSTLFSAALYAKRWAGPNSTVAAIMDAVVFKQVKAATGGRLQWGVSGGAALSRETQDFLSNALVPVIQGYGMTESCALSTILHPYFFMLGSVGCPVPSTEIKLVDFEEAGYFATNDPPQGEVWLRGHGITKGYFRRDDLTKEALTDDGWFKTGDIGQWNPNGTLSIIDRKKNLVKLAGGEYIALERLESIYKSCSVVNNICVYADSNASKPMAIIFPHEQNLKKLVADKGIKLSEHSDLKQLTDSDEVRKAVLAELNGVAKRENLKPLETLQTIVLTHEEWTPNNGLLTAAQKLQRKKILETYKKEVDLVYP